MRPRPFSVKTRFPSSIKQIIIPLSFRCLKRLHSLNICARFVISKLFIKEVLLNLFVCFDLLSEHWDSTLFQICFEYKIHQVQRTDPLTPLVLSSWFLYPQHSAPPSPPPPPPSSSSSSSSGLQIFPQTSRLMVLMKLVVCSRSSFHTRAFLQVWFLGASAVPVLPCIRGRTAEFAVGFVGLSHMGGRLAVCNRPHRGTSLGQKWVSQCTSVTCVSRSDPIISTRAQTNK